MSVVAIITARGGSKRIPKKNIKDFCGKPIIAYSIEAALKSELFDEVMVSTDSEEIAAVAQQYGAKVPFMRSEKKSDDYATTDDVLKEVVQKYAQQGHLFDIMCCIYPTAPFVTASKLVDAYEKFIESKSDMLQPVVSFSFPPQRAFIISEEKINYRFPECARMRSQDLEKWYHDAGQFYFYKVNKFMESIYDGQEMDILPFVLSELEVQDIDTITDWEIAELKYRLMSGR